MNKADLKQRWDKYTDTDKLVDDIMRLLNECNFRNTEHGVCTALDMYFTNKEPLIKLFQKSSNYIGDMRIVTEKEFERENNPSNIYNAVSWFSRDVDAASLIKKREDEHGKTFADYLSTGTMCVKASDLENKKFLSKFISIKENTDKFDCEGYTKASCKKYSEFTSLLYPFQEICASTISDSKAYIINNRKGDTPIKIVAGMKTSRAFNHICNVYGVDKAKDYNKVFAKYADLVSGLKRKLKFVISLNPYDYLTMSFGVSWTSCHNIKNHGGWCGGTLSYMLDSTSIITYCVGKDDNVQTDKKIYRNMFAYGNNMLLQSRIYPQGNDGNTDLYAVFRDLMHNEMSEILGLKENKWGISSGSQACRNATTSYGVHYRDYHGGRNCNITYPTEKANDINLYNHSLVVGHNGICVNCGHEITITNSLSNGHSCY